MLVISIEFSCALKSFYFNADKAWWSPLVGFLLSQFNYFLSCGALLYLFFAELKCMSIVEFVP